jgi:transposase
MSWLPHVPDVLVEEVFTAGRSVGVRARACGSSAACPGCGTVSRRVDDRYQRRLLDTASGGREVMICLTIRRFCAGLRPARGPLSPSRSAD